MAPHVPPTRLATLEISRFVDRPGLAEGLVPALLDHWRPWFPEDTWEARARRLEQHMNRDALPIGWVAHIGDQAIGTAALRSADLPGHEHLTPWLGGVFVRPEFRRRGVASALCAVVEDQARALGFERLYLFTLDQQALYRGLRWSPLERIAWRGVNCELMVKAIGASGPR